MLEHKNDKRMGTYTVEMLMVEGSTKDEYFFIPEKVDWSIWADLVLSANTDYYVEFDCPSHNKLSYKLVGNCELDYFVKMPDKSGKDYSKDRDSAVWQIDQGYKMTQNYTDAVIENPGVKINSIYYLTRFYKGLFNEVLASALNKQHEDAYKKIKTWAGNITSGLGFAPDPWGKLFSILSIGISNLPDYILRKLKDDLELKKAPVKVVISDNLKELIIHIEDRSSVDTYVYQIFENQQDISKDEIPATGDKYSIGNLAMFPGYTNDSSQEIAELFLAYLGNVADDYSKF